jgi:hypothetical protein
MSEAAKPCVLPSPTELELATLPGSEPGTAIRVSVEAGRDGYVRLEHLAFNRNVGWYTQKSFCIEGQLLATLVPQLNKADAMIPRHRREQHDILRFPTVETSAQDDAPRASQSSG